MFEISYRNKDSETQQLLNHDAIIYTTIWQTLKDVFNSPSKPQEYFKHNEM